MDLSIFSDLYLPAGLVIGGLAAAPIGPVNILVIQRSLRHGVAAALWSGLGAAFGDALFAGVAASGISALHRALHVHAAILRDAGGAIMCIFGLLLWRQAPHLDAAKPVRPTTGTDTLATFVMTVTNPATLLWFLAAFAMVQFRQIGIQSGQAMLHTALLVAGVLAGSMLWWLAIASLAAGLRQRLSDRHLLWMNHGAAAFLVTCGLVALVMPH